ncbi:MAG: invasion associated locus B family protein [Hyphomicrobiaceae bacterium]
MSRSFFKFASTLAFAASCALVIPTVGAQEKKPEKSQAKPKAQPGWSVECNNPGNGLVCKALQTLSLRRTGQRLVTVSVQRNKEGKSAAMLVHLPHGLFLPAGVTFKADKGKGKKLVVQTCDASGCYVGSKISASELDDWFDGKFLTIAFQNMQKKTISFKMPLKGFDVAFAKLK